MKFSYEIRALAGKYPGDVGDRPGSHDPWASPPVGFPPTSGGSERIALLTP